MICPKCKGNKCIKKGMIRGEQKYGCKAVGCGFLFTESTDLTKTHPDTKPPKVHKLANKLYLKGNSFRDIKDIIEDTFEKVTISITTLIRWVKKGDLKSKKTK
jgi:transposase-like protein